MSHGDGLSNAIFDKFDAFDYFLSSLLSTEAKMEIWKAVEGWEGFYEVSDAGRVRSLDRTIVAVVPGKTVHERRMKGKLLTPGKMKSGYRNVNFTRPGEREYFYVHTLVANAFLGPCPPGQETCHRNGMRAENHAGNLRYGTRSSNALDRHQHGTMNQAHGEDHYFHKLVEADVLWIRQNAGKMSRREMARRLDVTHGTVCRVINGESWRHVV